MKWINTDEYLQKLGLVHRCLQKPEVSYIRMSYIIVSYKRSCFFMLNFFLNWRIIDLQYCVVFCCTSTWISHRCTYDPSFLNLPPTSHPFPPHPTPLGCHRAPVWASCIIQQISTGYLLYMWEYICFHATLSTHLTLSFLPLALVHKSVLHVQFTVGV